MKKDIASKTDSPTSSSLQQDKLLDDPITRSSIIKTNEITSIKFSVGDILSNRFKLTRKLGKGGMGEVFSALDLTRKDSPELALKLLITDSQTLPQAIYSLEQEAYKTRALHHPNIIEVYEFHKLPSYVYFTMEKLSGQSLLEVIRDKKKNLDQNNRRNDFKTTLQILKQIAEGLSVAHENRIVHSDLKPANIFISDSSQIKILDFGISRLFNQEVVDITLADALTLRYASPEMISGESPHPSDDIFSLGIIACELFSQQHPFLNIDARSAKERSMDPVIPDGLPSKIKACLRQSLDFQRDKRINEARDFLKFITL